MSAEQPALFEVMPAASAAVQAEMDRTSRSQALGLLLSRAALVGACAGLALIGLWENFDRFANPNAFEETAYEAPLDLTPASLRHDIGSSAARGDRLSSVFVSAPQTDLHLQTDVALR